VGGFGGAQAFDGRKASNPTVPSSDESVSTGRIGGGAVLPGLQHREFAKQETRDYTNMGAKTVTFRRMAVQPQLQRTHNPPLHYLQ
jgi:hypothetical protein